MTLMPVIARELRASARQPFTYYLRVVGVTALLLASLLFGLDQGFAVGLGRQLFWMLHCTLFGAIWVLVPVLTADCISRERREGTLGLLFLTPLTGTDVVVAKGLTHGLRALTLGLAVLPVLTIPFLLGGVSRGEATLSLIVNANAICWALAAGLLASAWSRAWLRALVGAGTLAAAFLLVLTVLAGWLLLQALSTRSAGQFETNWDYVLSAGLGLVTNPAGAWANYTRWASVSTLLWVLGQATLVSLLVLVTAVLAAGAKTGHSWQEKPPSPGQVWLRQTFCTPVLWLGFFRRWMRHKLERNPIGWLEQRTWSGRLVTWAWFAVLISIYSAVLTDPRIFQGADRFQTVMAWLLAGSMAMSAAGSFRRERETGVLELLLVSPLGEGQIISGRLRGLWGQFFPAIGLLLAMWCYFSSFQPHSSRGGLIFFFALTFLAVPVFGLYFSLCCRNFLTAFLATAAAGLLLPLVLSGAFQAIRWAFSNANFDVNMRPSWAGAICQGALGAFCWLRLYRRLKKRAFPLEHAEP